MGFDGPRVQSNSWLIAQIGSLANPLGKSKNIFEAIRHAKAHGIEHLLVDAITIDQDQPGAELIVQVCAFAELYRTIPVLCAYYSPTKYTTFEETIKRPWLQFELQKFRRNPHVTVLNTRLGDHDYDGFSPVSKWLFDSHKRESTLGFSIMGLLRNEVEMASEADLRFMLGTTSGHAAAAHAQMDRDDHLLTIFLLMLLQDCSPAGTIKMDESFGRLSFDVWRNNYKRYTFENHYGGFLCPSMTDILLDSVSLAHFVDWPGTTIFSFQPDALQCITERLGMTERKRSDPPGRIIDYGSRILELGTTYKQNQGLLEEMNAWLHTWQAGGFSHDDYSPNKRIAAVNQQTRMDVIADTETMRQDRWRFFSSKAYETDNNQGLDRPTWAIDRCLEFLARKRARDGKSRQWRPKASKRGLSQNIALESVGIDSHGLQDESRPKDDFAEKLNLYMRIAGYLEMLKERHKRDIAHLECGQKEQMCKQMQSMEMSNTMSEA